MGAGRSKLSTKALHQLEESTLFTADEIQEWYKGFCKECPNGQMTLPQFLVTWKEIFAKSQKKTMDDAELEKYGKEVFRSIDKDSSGTIDFREFLLNASVQRRGTLAEKLGEIFNLYDLDKNGYVTKSEMHEFIKIVHKAVDFGTLPTGVESDPDILAYQLAHKIFWKLDRNKDGKLTIFEFISGVSSEPCLANYFLGARPDGR